MALLFNMVFAKKSFGQHFLHDQSVLLKIVAAAEIKQDDFVVEIGPGTGALTSHLKPLTSNLLLIEADEDLVPNLKEEYPDAKIVQADAATVNYDELTEGKPWIFVGNLPYNAGNAILMKALTASNPPVRLVVMLQKEVGERMLALKGAHPPKDTTGILSVAVALYAHVEKVCTVKPGAFNPPPKVDSLVLKLTPYPSDIDREKVVSVAKVGFANRRKQLHRNLAEAKMLTSEEVKNILKEFGLSELARAEELSLDQWVKLAQTVNAP